MAEDPPAAGSTRDGVDAPPLSDVRLTDTQRGILIALCRPRADGNRYGTAATNQEIAAEVFLSVDAVKAHLRALYRKFGVEPLPHNQKRARLVELVLEGGLLSPGQLQPAGDDGAASDQAPVPAAVDQTGAPRAPETPGVVPPPQRHSSGQRAMIAGSAAFVAVAALALVLTGALSGGSAEDSPEGTTTPAQYKAAVNGYCRLALAGQGQLVGASTAERARSYLGVIETMGGRLESLTPPPADNRDLVLFSNGLRRAADFTSRVAQGPPPPGTRKSANVIAELTLAAGQVQAGAVGYGLGEDCSAIGSLVARSARNAAFVR
jgi:hypothetical protein